MSRWTPPAGSQGFRDIIQSGLRVNGGFFVFRKEIFDYIQRGRRTGRGAVQPPRGREAKLLAYDYDGFWVPMDTAKDKARLDELHGSGKPPWYVWTANGQTENK